MKIKFDWEEIWEKKNEVYFTYVARAKVYGGWLIKDMTQCDFKREYFQFTSSLVFIPDPDHCWEVDQE